MANLLCAIDKLKFSGEENEPSASRFLKKAPQKLLQRAKRVSFFYQTNDGAKIIFVRISKSF
jgi:hypothetical protein